MVSTSASIGQQGTAHANAKCSMSVNHIDAEVDPLLENLHPPAHGATMQQHAQPCTQSQGSSGGYITSAMWLPWISPGA